MTPTSDSSDSTFDHTKARTKTGDPIRPSPHEENGEASKSQISPLSWEDETCWIWLLVSSQSFQVFRCRIYGQARRNGSNTYLIPENHQYRVNHDGNVQLSSYWYDHTVVLARLIMARFIVRTGPHISEIGNRASR